MKVRNGFVSNSSSSSFVLVLPDNFLEKIDYDKITDGYENFPLDAFKELLKQFVEQDGMCDEEIYEFENDLLEDSDEDYEEEYEFYGKLYELVEPYIVVDIEGGPDNGQFVIIDRKTIEDKLKNIE